MSWILDHLNIVIVAILVIGSFLKSRFDSVNQDEPEAEDYPDFEDEQRQSPPPVPYVPPMVERAPEPPPLAQPPPVFAATRSVSGAMTASADEAAIILTKQREIEERMQAIRETRNANRAKGSPLRPRAVTGKPVPVAMVATSIRGRLRNPAELRRAVILREILGPPVGLR